MKFSEWVITTLAIFFLWFFFFFFFISGSVSWCVQHIARSKFASHHTRLWWIRESGDKITLRIYFKLFSLWRHSPKSLLSFSPRYGIISWLKANAFCLDAFTSTSIYTNMYKLSKYLQLKLVMLLFRAFMARGKFHDLYLPHLVHELYIYLLMNAYIHTLQGWSLGCFQMGGKSKG